MYSIKEVCSLRTHPRLYFTVSVVEAASEVVDDAIVVVDVVAISEVVISVEETIVATAFINRCSYSRWQSHRRLLWLSSFVDHCSSSTPSFVVRIVEADLVVA